MEKEGNKRGNKNKSVKHQRCNLGRRYDNKDVCYADEASCTIIRLAYTVSINYTRNKNMHMSATVMRQLYGSSGSILHFFTQLLIWNHWIINRFFAIKFFSRVINENLKKGKEKKKRKNGRKTKKKRTRNQYQNYLTSKDIYVRD